MLKSSVIFVRGLNSYGDDSLHLGPLKIGRMDHHLDRYFSNRQTSFITLPDIGKGDFERHLENLKSSLKRVFDQGQVSNSVHIVAHSAGGVLSRALVHDSEFSHRILSLTTIGTPHRGSQLAHAVIGFNKHHKNLDRFFRTFGYDATQRTPNFSWLTRQAMTNFNESVPNLPNIVYACFVFNLRPELRSSPIRLLNKSLSLSEPGDGLVTPESQAWGQCLGELQLDHLQQLGYNLHLIPKHRRRINSEFLKMLDQMIFHLESVEE